MVDINKFYTKASEAFEKKNYEYAISLFRQILNNNPDEIKSRQALRMAQIKLSTEKGQPSSFILGLKSVLIKLKILYLKKVKKDNKKIINLIEEALDVAPEYFIKDRILIGKCLLEDGHKDGAITELEGIIQYDTENIESITLLGKLYKEKGDIKKAIEYFQNAAKLVPDDRILQQYLKDALALDTVQAGKWDEAESSQDILRDKELTQRLEKRTRIVMTKKQLEEEISNLEKMISSNPNNPENEKHYVKLADMLIRLKKFDAALNNLNEALVYNPTNNELKAKIGDVKIKQFDFMLSDLVARYKKTKDADLEEQIKKLHITKYQFQIDEFTKRVSEHPTDNNLHFRLGESLYRFGKTTNNQGLIDRGISEFQIVAKDPKYKKLALEFLGLSFMAKGIFDLALEQFEKLAAMNLPDGKMKAIHYNLALIYEKQGKIQEAKAILKKIIEVDINYKDVNKRLINLSEK